MLGHLVLIILQIIAGWFGTPRAMSYLPSGLSELGTLATAAIEAAVCAVIVWLVGVLFSFVLEGVRTPGSSTLGATLVGSLIGAAVVVFTPAFGLGLPGALTPQLLPIAGAVLGYLVRR